MRGNKYNQSDRVQLVAPKAYPELFKFYGECGTVFAIIYTEDYNYFYVLRELNFLIPEVYLQPVTDQFSPDIPLFPKGSKVKFKQSTMSGQSMRSDPEWLPGFDKGLRGQFEVTYIRYSLKGGKPFYTLEHGPQNMTIDQVPEKFLQPIKYDMKRTMYQNRLFMSVDAQGKLPLAEYIEILNGITRS